MRFTRIKITKKTSADGKFFSGLLQTLFCPMWVVTNFVIIVARVLTREIFQCPKTEFDTPSIIIEVVEFFIFQICYARNELRILNDDLKKGKKEKHI